MKHIFIINPHAGKRSTVNEIASRIADVQAMNIYNMDVVFTNSPEDVIALIERLDDSEDYRFYACGGDGTLHELVQHCVHKENYTLIPIPVGSGNDFVRSFLIDKKEFFDIEQMMQAERFPIDTIKVGGFHCMNTASIGLDATIGDMSNRIKKKGIAKGSLAYIVSFLGSLATKISFPMDFKVDGNQMPITDYNFFVAANGKYYGGGFMAAPDARLDDGKLDIIMIHSATRRRMVNLAPKYRKGEHLQYSDIVESVKANIVEFTSTEDLTINLDGEIKKIKSPKIEIDTLSLFIATPKEA